MIYICILYIKIFFDNKIYNRNKEKRISIDL